MCACASRRRRRPPCPCSIDVDGVGRTRRPPTTANTRGPAGKAADRGRTDAARASSRRREVVGVKGERWHGHGMAIYTAICKHLTSLIRYPQLASLSSSPITMDSLAVAHTAKARVVTDIIKSQNDDRSHRGLVLDNGLKVGTCLTYLL